MIYQKIVWKSLCDKILSFDDDLCLGAHQLPRVHVVRSHGADVVQQD